LRKRTRSPLSNNTKPCQINAIIVSTHKGTLKPPPLAKLFDNDTEYRHFKIYIEQTSLHLAGCHKLDIWTALVPQVSEADAGIRHAVTAIGALSVSLRRLSLNTDIPCQHQAFAYRQYSKAIEVVRKSCLQGSTPIERKLLACILFATFEGIHGNAKSMTCFIGSGIGMIEDYMTAPGTNKPINAIILEVFTVLEIEAGVFRDGVRIFLNPKYLEDSIGHSLPDRFVDLKEARIKIMVIVSKGLRWMYDRYHHTSEMAPETVERELDEHLTSLRKWSKAFKPLLTTCLSLPQGSFNFKAAAMIRAHYLAYYLWLCTASPNPSTYYRMMTKELNEIVYLIELVCAEVKGEVFATAVRMVIPIVVVALRYKHKGARRRALNLIPKLPGKGAGFMLGSVVGVLGKWVEVLEGCDGGDREDERDEYVNEDKACKVVGFEVNWGSMTVDATISQMLGGKEVVRERVVSWA
jgi:hypothetical protein